MHGKSASNSKRTNISHLQTGTLLLAGVFSICAVATGANAQDREEVYAALNVGGTYYTPEKAVDSSGRLPDKDRSFAEITNGASLGTAWTFDHLYFGFEARGALTEGNLQRSARDAKTINTLPLAGPTIECLGSCGYPGHITKYIIEDMLPLTKDERTHFNLENNYNADLSTRFGIATGPYVIFAKVGGGIQSFRASYSTDDTRDDTCTKYVQTSIAHKIPGGYEATNSITDCLTHVSGPRSHRSDAQIAPNVLLGIGGEYHFSSMFIRGEIEISHAFSQAGWAGMNFEQPGFTAVSSTVSLGIDL